MTTAAQQEFNDLLANQTDRQTKHPEDRHDTDSNSEPDTEPKHYYEKDDTDDELDLPKEMRSNYYLPSIRSEANTGPKGVIADAHAFEQAKKQARRFTWSKKQQPEGYTVTAYHDDKHQSSDEDKEEGFMRQWREARLKELQTAGERIRSRTTSPSRRVYGTMPRVDGEGYLEALEKVARDVTVVVFIYDNLVCSRPVTSSGNKSLTRHSPRHPTWWSNACSKSPGATTPPASSSFITKTRKWRTPACLPSSHTGMAISSPALSLSSTSSQKTQN
jgi:hypothetical protein